MSGVRWTGACLMTLVLAACGGGPAPDNPAQEPAAPPVAYNTTWATFHGDAGLTGYVAAPLPGSLALRWRYTGEGEVRNTPVAGGGRLFFSDDAGTVTALTFDGEKAWSRTLMREADPGKETKPEVLDPPLVWHEGKVIAAAADGAVYALEGATGETAWRVDTDATLLGSPAYDGERLYLITQDEGRLQARDADTGVLAWESDPVSRCDGSLSAGTDFAVFGSCDAALHVRSLADGATRFNIPIDDDSQVAGGVAIDGNAVFSGSRSGAVVHADAATGKTVWTNRDSTDEVFTTPAVTAKWVVTTGLDGVVRGLDRETGEARWTFDTGGEPASPVVAGDAVVVTSDGTLFVLALEDGTERWSYPVSDTVTGPAVVGGMVVVGCDDGSVAAFGAG